MSKEIQREMVGYDRFFTVPHYSLFKPLTLSIPKENLELSYEGFYTEVLKMTASPPPLFILNINN